MIEEEEDDSLEQLQLRDVPKWESGKQLKLLDERAHDSNELLHFKLRLTPEMHEKLKILAVQNKRTMSHEIVARLEGSFDASLSLPPGLLERVRKLATHYKMPVDKYIIKVVESDVSMEESQLEYYEEQARVQQLDLGELNDEEYEKLKKYTEEIRLERQLAWIKSRKKLTLPANLTEDDSIPAESLASPNKSLANKTSKRVVNKKRAK